MCEAEFAQIALEIEDFASLPRALGGLGVGILNAADDLAGGRAAVAQGARQAAQPRAGQKIYRVYGGDPQEADLWMAKKYSGPFGQSRTPIDPTTIPNYRQVAGLPDLNKGRFLIVAELLDPTGVKVQPACPYGRWRGGLVEYVLPQPVEARIRVLEVIGLNPPF